LMRFGLILLVASQVSAKPSIWSWIKGGVASTLEYGQDVAESTLDSLNYTQTADFVALIDMEDMADKLVGSAMKVKKIADEGVELVKKGLNINGTGIGKTFEKALENVGLEVKFDMGKLNATKNGIVGKARLGYDFAKDMAQKLFKTNLDSMRKFQTSVWNTTKSNIEKTLEKALSKAINGDDFKGILTDVVKSAVSDACPK